MSGRWITDKLLCYASDLDGATVEQALKTSQLQIVDPYLVLMPDAHLGKGATVGSVIPTVGAIIPAAVGVDIGCGMMAVRTQFTRQDMLSIGKPLATLRQEIERAIPLSAGRYNNHETESAKDFCDLLEQWAKRDYSEVAPNWRLQLGSLGSGNHFIEVSYDEQDRVWLFLHSGSRGIGNRLANEHIKAAKTHFADGELSDPDLAWLEENTAEFDSYIEDLWWAQDFAMLNREEMMNRVVRQVSEFMGGPVVEQDVIHCHHNYTETVGHDYWGQFYLSRKGAIDAEDGEYGLIPGSMGTASYVVEGKGNEEALWSAPHGAGRRLSRTQAKKTFTLDALAASMSGIEYNHSDAFLDEHPGAYKDISRVMVDAQELVSIRHELRQLINVKGD